MCELAVDLQIVPATLEHVPYVAAHMRAADVLELADIANMDPERALVDSVSKSDLAFSAIINGRPACIFGAGSVNLLCAIGSAWLLGTDDVAAHYRLFIRHSKEWRNKLLAQYSVLTNIVDDRNTLTVRWLTWMGAEFSSAFPYGPKRVPARVFELRR